MPFDAGKVPTEYAEFFYSGKDGSPLTDAEWDEQKARLREAAVELPWEHED